MFNYVPILKGKQGEYFALRDLEASLKSKITPLIEIPSIPWDWEAEAPAKTINEHLIRVPLLMEQSLGTSKDFFVDLSFIEPDERMADNRHPLTYLFDEGRLRSLKMIPVTGIGRDDHYQTAVADIISQDRRGLCIRLESDDFGEIDLEAEISILLSRFNLKPRQVHLLIDFKGISGNILALFSRTMVNLINSLPNLEQWRTLTFSGSGFPPTLTGIVSFTSIGRSEWTIWRSLLRSSALKRKPDFGDYGVDNPEPNEVDFRIMQMSANIRYTVEENWLIVKGRGVRRHGWDQYHALCRGLIGNPEFRGRAYSWADDYIYQCANNQVGTGNAPTWRRVGFNHHLTLVINQISNLP